MPIESNIILIKAVETLFLCSKSSNVLSPFFLDFSLDKFVKKRVSGACPLSRSSLIKLVVPEVSKIPFPSV